MFTGDWCFEGLACTWDSNKKKRQVKVTCRSMSLLVKQLAC